MRMMFALTSVCVSAGDHARANRARSQPDLGSAQLYHHQRTAYTPAPAIMCSCGNESGRLGLVGTRLAAHKLLSGCLRARMLVSFAHPPRMFALPITPFPGGPAIPSTTVRSRCIRCQTTPWRVLSCRLVASAKKHAFGRV